MRNIFSRPMFVTQMLEMICSVVSWLVDRVNPTSYQPPKPKTIGETVREIKDFIVTPADKASTIGQAKAAKKIIKKVLVKRKCLMLELFKQDKIKADKAEKERLDKIK